MKIRKPQGAVHAYLQDRGRVWVECINTQHKTAIVRFDPDTGMRSVCEKVKLSDIDFTREWKWR